MPEDPKNLQPPQHQDRQPGLETEMTSRPRSAMENWRAAGKLEGRTALISGGDSGIGRAVAIGFAKEGADVVILHKEEPRDAEDMPKGVSIINTTSITAHQGSPAPIDYASTKGAIVGFTRSLAKAIWKDRRIRVNAVAPGPIWTPLIPASFDEARTAQHGASVTTERAGQPDEVAPAFLFLAAEQDSSYFTGQVLHPNGGTIVNA